MDFDKYSMYSKSSSFDYGQQQEVAKVLAKLEELRNFRTESEVKKFLSDNWQIKGDVWNYTLANNIIMHVYNGSEFFNVTYENFDEKNRVIRAFNYIKNN